MFIIDVGFLDFCSKITIIQIYCPLNFVFILLTWTDNLHNFSSLLGPIIAQVQYQVKYTEKKFNYIYIVLLWYSYTGCSLCIKRTFLMKHNRQTNKWVVPLFICKCCGILEKLKICLSKGTGGGGFNQSTSNKTSLLVISHFESLKKTNKMVVIQILYNQSIKNGGLKRFEIFQCYTLK